MADATATTVASLREFDAFGDHRGTPYRLEGTTGKHFAIALTATELLVAGVVDG